MLVIENYLEESPLHNREDGAKLLRRFHSVDKFLQYMYFILMSEFKMAKHRCKIIDINQSTIPQAICFLKGKIAAMTIVQTKCNSALSWINSLQKPPPQLISRSKYISNYSSKLDSIKKQYSDTILKLQNQSDWKK